MSKKPPRQTSIATLHPLIRRRVEKILKQLKSEGLEFRVFEAWRSAQLQQFYFNKGRNSSGRIVQKSDVVTYARPWRSYHQFGLAVDLVLKTAKGWSWDDTGRNATKWKRMHEVARAHGMEPLRFEKPHIQAKDAPPISSLAKGVFPVGGDPKWHQKLAAEISKWDGNPAAPPHLPIPKGKPTSIGNGFATGEDKWPEMIEQIFSLEGGFSDHPKDPGGATNFGITLKTLSDWRSHKANLQDLMNLEISEATAIYRKNYFLKSGANGLPDSIALHLLNAAVMSGPKRAITILQQALNRIGDTLAVDGILGNRTKTSVLGADPVELCEHFHIEYRAYLKNLPHWDLFGKGWSARLRKINKKALKWASETSDDSKLKRVSGSPSLQIFLFRGLLGRIFSTGIDNLAKKLAKQGHEVTLANWYDQSKTLARIEQIRSKTLRKKIILIGHSLGANTAIRLGDALEKVKVPVHYCALLDPTMKNATSKSLSTDVFLSNDLRARTVRDAQTFNRTDLSHIEIDKDEAVHSTIIERCETLINQQPEKPEEKPMTQREELLEEITALLNALWKRDTGKLESPADPMTPVNSIFGKGPIGQFLNGKKTLIGLLGLVGTQVLPVLFPQAQPIFALLNSIGLEAAQTDPQAGQKILTALFGAFTAWGGLGKLEKWAMEIAARADGTKP